MDCKRDTNEVRGNKSHPVVLTEGDQKHPTATGDLLHQSKLTVYLGMDLYYMWCASHVASPTVNKIVVSMRNGEWQHCTSFDEIHFTVVVHFQQNRDLSTNNEQK